MKQAVWPETIQSMNTLSAMSIARRLAQISPQAKMWVMVGCDALFLPWCMFASVGFRLDRKSVV